MFSERALELSNKLILREAKLCVSHFIIAISTRISGELKVAIEPPRKYRRCLVMEKQRMTLTAVDSRDSDGLVDLRVPHSGRDRRGALIGSRWMNRRYRHHRRTQLCPVRQMVRVRSVRARVKPPSGINLVIPPRQSLRQLLRLLPIGQLYWFLFYPKICEHDAKICRDRSVVIFRPICPVSSKQVYLTFGNTFLDIAVAAFLGPRSFQLLFQFRGRVRRCVGMQRSFGGMGERLVEVVLQQERMRGGSRPEGSAVAQHARSS